MVKNSIFVFIMVLSIFFIKSPKLWAFCFEEAGKRYGVSPILLWSIAHVESNFNASAIGYNSNGSRDYGLMQINSRWTPVLGLSEYYLLQDPCYNVMIGAWILRRCIAMYGNTWKAIGCYNSSSESKRARYAWKINKSLNYAYSILKKTEKRGGRGVQNR